MNRSDDWQITAALQAAKARIEPKYHRGLDIMSGYQAPGDDNETSTPGFDKLSVIVQAAQAALREDLVAFIDQHLLGWLKSGLWPPTSPSNVGDHALSIQRSLDMIDAEVYEDEMAKILMRRLVRVRLCYWHDEQIKALRANSSSRQADQGVGLETEAADMLLRNAYVEWEQFSEQTKQNVRDRFHARKRVGRRWCELAQFLGPGILITCGANMDTQIRNFPPYGTHGIAIYVQNCFPSLIHVCRYFESVVEVFLRRGRMTDSALNDWRIELDEESLRKGIEELRDEPRSPEMLMNPRPVGGESSESTTFVRKALSSE
ncbi:uncharacterized protein BO97DRAFT_401802 [Aspergillus homomorphus CBS 101889]|uniref:Uncharacterized protein n=1 Tax=Aspergillus homomorphus (strain CBS 101889) TaxID=1450537 RepID=A0A395HHQ3_ASPHC|nr:hypothetical protein BO97DRAFT_401802 [Aspergillus homomorphus CBS 101889]RAL06508.1 hypothetical protein BO97DRAFT_401802 [Aspergillus homomorphus CBS 101889]